MDEGMRKHNLTPWQSFGYTEDQFQYIPYDTPHELPLFFTATLNEIMKCTLYQRQGRVEPREIKQRPKPFKLMTKPRSILRAEMLAQAA